MHDAGKSTRTSRARMRRPVLDRRRQISNDPCARIMGRKVEERGQEIAHVDGGGTNTREVARTDSLFFSRLHQLPPAAAADQGEDVLDGAFEAALRAHACMPPQEKGKSAVQGRAAPPDEQSLDGPRPTVTRC